MIAEGVLIQILTWTAKLVGAFLGAILSLLYLRPETKREAWLRGSASFIVALLFGAQVLGQLVERLPSLWTMTDLEHIASAYGLTALLGWWGLGVLIKVTRVLESKIIQRAGDRDQQQP